MFLNCYFWQKAFINDHKTKFCYFDHIMFISGQFKLLGELPVEKSTYDNVQKVPMVGPMVKNAPKATKMPQNAQKS